MPLITRDNFYLNFAFRIEEEGFAVSFFQKITQIKINNEIIKYQEGGALVDYLTLGRTTIDDITFTRGMNANRDIHDWMTLTTNTVADIGGGDEQKRTFDIIQQNRGKIDIARFRLHGCLLKDSTIGDWDNSGNDLLMESMTLAVTAVEEIAI